MIEHSFEFIRLGCVERESGLFLWERAGWNLGRSDNMPAESSKYDQKLVFVLKSAAAIFAAKGYHSTSIRDIARATGMSLSGLYYYFRSKDELLFLIQDYCFGTLIDRCRELIDTTDDPVRRLKLLVENHLGFFVHNMNEMKVLSHEANSISGEYLKKVNAKKRQYVEIVTRLLEEIASDRGILGIDMRVAAFSLFGMMNWIYNWYRPRRDVDVGELSANMMRLFLFGFLSREDSMEQAGWSGEAAHLDEAVSVWRP